MSDIVGFGLSLGTAAYNNWQNRSSMDLQYQYSRSLADQQNSANYAMWQLNNSYNSPAQQMQRLRDAGLNPQLAYGNQPQADSPQLVGGSTPTSQITPLSASDIQNSMLLEAQKENIQADTALKLKDVELKGSEITLNAANAALLGKQYQWTDKQMELASKEIESMQQSIEESKSRVSQIEADIKLKSEQTNKTAYEAMSAYIDSLFAHYEHNQALRESVARTNLSVAEVKRILTLLPLESDQVSQHTKNMKKEQVLLVQAIKTGKIPANLAAKYPNFLEFIQLWKQLSDVVQVIPVNVK